jgi:hypothetical protein
VLAALVAGGLLAAVAWAILELHSGSLPSQDGKAAVLASDTAVVGAVMASLGMLNKWRKANQAVRPRAAQLQLAACDELANHFLAFWQGEAYKRGLVTPSPAVVPWRRWASHEVAAPGAGVSAAHVPGAGPRPLPADDARRPGWAPFLPASGVITCLHDEVYRQLPYGRLVLVGRSGSGKTGAMVLVLLATLAHRGGLPASRRDEVPVPLWLTLSGWDPRKTSLSAWAARQMGRDPGIPEAVRGRAAAAGLLRDGRVALFLDGLDEMPPHLRARALARVDREAMHLRIVLTSRRGEYATARADHRLHNAAVIEMQPVQPQDAASFLLQEEEGTQRDQWRQVGDYIQARPDSAAARTLDNPLTLTLARAVYRRADPREIADNSRFTSPEALRNHLLTRVMVIAYPDEDGRAEATRQLALLAGHMGNSRDLAWWRDLPSLVPRWQLFLMRGIAAGLPAGLVTGLLMGLASAHARGMAAGMRGGFGGMLETGLTAGLGAGLVLHFASSHEGTMRIRALRWPRMRDLPQMFSAGLWGCLIAGSAIGSAVTIGSLLARVAVRFTIGHELDLRGLELTGVQGLEWGVTVGAVMFALLRIWGTPPARSAPATIEATYHADRRAAVASAIAAGICGAGATALVDRLSGGTVVALTQWIAVGFTTALTVALSVSLMLQVVLTELLLRIRGHGRVSFIRLLKDAHQRGILRRVGPLYQFTHAELQDYLAATITQQPKPSTSQARPATKPTGGSHRRDSARASIRPGTEHSIRSLRERSSSRRGKRG